MRPEWLSARARCGVMLLLLLLLLLKPARSLLREVHLQQHAAQRVRLGIRGVPQLVEPLVPLVARVAQVPWLGFMDSRALRYIYMTYLSLFLSP